MAKRRRPIQRAGRHERPRRAGTPYEDAVCELFRQFFPAARINPGVWVEGPDGRRELDVHIQEVIGDKQIRGIVECKDFNPQTTGPVGIGYLDALDSKRRDLALDYAFLCSNAGFTADAIRKARRVDIGLLGATRRDDNRIRFAIVDEIYTRHIRIAEAPKCRFWQAEGEPPLTKELIESGEPQFEGRPIESWFFQRFMQVLGVNPIVKGRYTDTVRFRSPIKLNWPRGSALIEKLAFEIAIEGAWFGQTVRLQATAGFYDWLRRRMRLAPGPGPRELQVVGINYFGGKWIAQPPDTDWKNQRLLPYEHDLKFIVLKNQFPLGNPAALTPHVLPEDLNVTLDGVDDSNIQSVPGFTPDRVPEADVGKQLWPEPRTSLATDDSEAKLATGGSS